MVTTEALVFHFVDHHIQSGIVKHEAPWTDRQTTLPKVVVVYVWEKKRGVFLVNLSNSTVNRDKTTLSIKRTLVFNKGSIFFFHNNT